MTDHLASSLDAARERLKAQAPEPGEYLTASEAAALARCHPKTIYRAVTAGHLPRRGATARVLLLEADVRAWIENGPPPPPSCPLPRMPGGRSSSPGSVAALRAMDPEMT